MDAKLRLALPDRDFIVRATSLGRYLIDTQGDCWNSTKYLIRNIGELCYNGWWTDNFVDFMCQLPEEFSALASMAELEQT